MDSEPTELRYKCDWCGKEFPQDELDEWYPPSGEALVLCNECYVHAEMEL